MHYNLFSLVLSILSTASMQIAQVVPPSAEEIAVRRLDSVVSRRMMQDSAAIFRVRRQWAATHPTVQDALVRLYEQGVPLAGLEACVYRGSAALQVDVVTKKYVLYCDYGLHHCAAVERPRDEFFGPDQRMSEDRYYIITGSVEVQVFPWVSGATRMLPVLHRVPAPRVQCPSAPAADLDLRLDDDDLFGPVLALDTGGDPSFAYGKIFPGNPLFRFHSATDAYLVYQAVVEGRGYAVAVERTLQSAPGRGERMAQVSYRVVGTTALRQDGRTSHVLVVREGL